MELNDIGNQAATVELVKNNGSLQESIGNFVKMDSKALM
jgi:hypothetical protein